MVEPNSSSSSRPLSRAKAQAGWPGEALAQAVALQRSLAIGDRDWHALKTQRARRAAEQLSAALVQLLSGDDPASAKPTLARQRAIDLVTNSLGWLKAELSDPGCQTHQR